MPLKKHLYQSSLGQIEIKSEQKLNPLEPIYSDLLLILVQAHIGMCLVILPIVASECFFGK